MNKKSLIFIIVILIAMLIFVYVFNNRTTHVEINPTKDTTKFVQEDISVADKMTSIKDNNQQQKLDNKKTIEMVKLTKEQQSIYEQLVGKTKRIYILQQTANKPIYFVGKIIDQDGNGVQGVEITYSVAHFPLIPQPDFAWVTQSKRVTSDSTGLFVINDETGVNIMFRRFKKSGYEFSKRSNIPLKSYKDFPDDKIWSDYTNVNPYIFKSWKKTKPAPLVHDTKFIGFRHDGRVYSLNFMKQRIIEEGDSDGDLIISMTKSQAINNRFDWSVNIETKDGGIIESVDEIMNKAPTNGYKRKWTIKVNKNDKNWKSRINKRFYILSNKRYGRIEMRFVPGYQHNLSAIDITYWINPAGSTNLQYSWKK